MRLARTVPIWAPLAALIGLSVVLRFLGSLAVPAPWIAADEMVYAELGRSLFASGRLEILGHETGFYTLVYPLLVGLPLSLTDVEIGYRLLKFVQAVAMSLAAVPVYLWCRPLAGRRLALLAATLTLAIPGLAYVGFVMTEVAFYPVMALAAWRLAAALERPTLQNQALFVGVGVIAAATRLQALVLLPVAMTAAVLFAAAARSYRPVRALWPMLAAIAALVVAWTAGQAVGGDGLAEGLGAYEAAGRTTYSAGEALKYVTYHAGDAVLLVGVVPACTLVLLLVRILRGAESEAVRACVAVAASFTVWLVVEVGVFASRHVGHLAERDLLTLAPPLFVTFSVWLARGAPRTRLSAALVGLGVAAPVLTLPLRRFVTQAALPDSFTLAPLYVLRQRSGEAAVDLVVFVGAAALAVAFTLVPRRMVSALPAAVLAVLIGSSVVATRVVADQSSAAVAKIVAPEKRWIDRSAPSSVSYLYDGDPFWNVVWEQLFWNRRLRSVYRISWARRVPGPLQQPALAPRGDGVLLDARGRTIGARYLVAPASFTFFGEPISQTPPLASSDGLFLWRLERPARVSTIKAGVGVGGDISLHGRLVAYACARGFLGLTLIAKGQQVQIMLRSGDQVAARFSLAPAEIWRGEIPGRPSASDGSGQCEFDIETSGIVGSTRFEFVRM